MLEPLARVAALPVCVQPVLRDARPEHFLFEDGRLSGLVDFGAMGVDSVAADLARLIGDWFDGDRDLRREALAAYEAVRPLSAERGPFDLGVRGDGGPSDRRALGPVALC